MKPGDRKYVFLPHTADIKIQASGATEEDAFASAALALKEAICGDIRVGTSLRKHIEVSGRDKEAVLCAFLEEFLYLLDAEGFLLSDIESIVISGNSLAADVTGDKAGNYAFNNSVKAVTYSEMLIRRESTRWLLQFVLDV